MDFSTHLPTTTAGYDCITTYVDRFSKRIHLVPSKAADPAVNVARKFFRDLFRLHELPEFITADRDSRFTAKFLKKRMDCCSVKMKTFCPSSVGVERSFSHRGIGVQFCHRCAA